MKKSILLFISCIVSITGQAQVSFLESVKSARATPSAQVFAQIAEWAQTPNRYLSLGESHGEPESVRPINFKLAKTFRDNLKNRYTMCSETIQDFLDSDQGKDLQAAAENVLIFTGNGPSRTDFANCKWNSKSSAITYSGFYHQYPFAKAWPADFPVTPVTSEPNNNIAAELSPRKGLFVSQIELAYLESLASRNFLRANNVIDAKTFRSRVTAMTANVHDITSKMELLLGEQNDNFQNKFGLFLPKEALTENVNMSKESWLLITSRGERIETPPLRFINQLLTLDDQKLEAFLAKIHKAKPYYLSMQFGPDQTGKRGSTVYGGVDMDGEAEVLQLGTQLIVLDYNSEKFVCYEQGKDTLPAQEIICDGVMF